jgi:hypothetical protein
LAPTSYDAPQEAFVAQVEADGSGLGYAGFLTGGGGSENEKRKIIFLQPGTDFSHFEYNFVYCRFRSRT